MFGRNKSTATDEVRGDLPVSETRIMPIEVTIKRVKNGATHYATEVADAGNVTRWSANKADAVRLTADEADAVEIHYAGLLNGGTIHFLRDDGSPARPKVEGTTEAPVITLPQSPVESDAIAKLQLEKEAAKGETDKLKAEKEAEIAALEKLIEPKKLAEFRKAA